MAVTEDLVSGRFDVALAYADSALSSVSSYTSSLSSFLDALELPTAGALEAIDPPDIEPIDYSARPSFAAQLESFPTFNNIAPPDPTLASIPSVDVTVPTENIDFTENTYVAPTPDIDKAPKNWVTIESIGIPTAPSLDIPTVPTLDDIIIPSAPDINLASFSATAPGITEQSTPGAFSYTPDAYNSDIRATLFAKILSDLANGGTGLDVTVEADIYARGRERQRVENESLYRETENRFTATGFDLPTGALVSALQSVTEEMSRKIDQLNREITINQADLAQKNTQFTTDQARQIEIILVDFYNNQEARTLEASKAIVQNSIDIFNAVLSNQRLKLENYQVEAAVFEAKIRAQIAAIEIYKAEIEGVKASSDIQMARVNIYNAQLSGLEILLKLYSVEMESAKIQSEIQMAEIEAFKAEIEAYSAGVDAEKVKADIYGTQIESEKARAGIYSERVKALALKVDSAKTVAEIKQINAENILKTNQLAIAEFTALIGKYGTEIEAEIKNAQLQVEAFKTEAMAFEAESNAAGMEYSAKINEGNLMVEEFKAQIQEQIAIINSTRDGYVALKSLQEKGTEGVINVNAQLAASAMNAVNASAGQSISHSTTVSE